MLDLDNIMLEISNIIYLSLVFLKSSGNPVFMKISSVVIENIEKRKKSTPEKHEA
jgi:hypothetical protein